MKPTVTIIGGGLSGLVVAYRLTQQGVGFKLFEANSRLGGRILSTTTVDGGQYCANQPAIDLGPSWFWPGQHHIASLIKELGLSDFVYSQTSAGDSVMEYGDGAIVSGKGSASMAGSYRLSGGLYHLIQQLTNRIPEDALVTSAQVMQIRREAESAVSVVELAGEAQDIISQEVVLALPPRVVARTIEFTPSLASEYLSSLVSVPTWMAGQAKLVAVYENRFWHDSGLSGDALSQLGPLVEIHDASPQSGGPYALFGFVGVPVEQRMGRSDHIKADAVSQLTRMFGNQAANPLSVHLKDWAYDPLTSIDLDRNSPRMHAARAPELTNVPGHDAVWAGTETAHSTNHSNGYIEGAVEAGERAASLIVERLAIPRKRLGDCN